MSDEQMRGDAPDRWSRLVAERDEARVRAGHFRRQRDEAIEAHRRVVENESNHYNRYWTPPDEAVSDEWLNMTETKMREALTDAFCDDVAAIMLTLIAEIRRLRVRTPITPISSRGGVSSTRTEENT